MTVGFGFTLLHYKTHFDSVSEFAFYDRFFNLYRHRKFYVIQHIGISFDLRSESKTSYIPPNKISASLNKCETLNFLGNQILVMVPCLQEIDLIIPNQIHNSMLLCQPS